MVKNKKYLIVGAILIVVLIGGSIFAALHKHSGTPQLSLLNGDATNFNTVSRSNGSNASQNVPLTQTSASASSTNSGLSVSSDTAANRLGQITPSPKAQSSGDTSSSSGNSSSPFDPKTYAQYEKYKSGSSALFGDAQKGDGPELSDGKKAAVYYRGWLTNGTLFDESRTGSDGKLQPFVFTLGAHQVIPGWEQALSGMKVGGVRLVIVPPSVGYGASGQGSIPANSVLVFQVQLAAVQ